MGTQIPSPHHADMKMRSKEGYLIDRHTMSKKARWNTNPDPLIPYFLLSTSINLLVKYIY